VPAAGTENRFQREEPSEEPENRAHHRKAPFFIWIDAARPPEVAAL
jgi:hypothetical protein